MDFDENQIRFLHMFAMGLDLNTISKNLKLQPNTLRFWKSQFRKQLSVKSDAQLILQAICSNLEFKNLMESLSNDLRKRLDDVQLTLLERVVIIELIQGISKEVISKSLSSSDRRLREIISGIERKLKNNKTRAFIQWSMAYGDIAFKSNRVGSDILTSYEEVWSLYQQYMKEARESGLLFQPVFGIRVIESMTLTPAEKEVLKLRLFGYSSSQIGDIMKVSRQSINGKLQIIKKKLNCNTPSDLVRKALESGLVKSQIFKIKPSSLSKIEDSVLVGLLNNKPLADMAKERNVKQSTVRQNIRSMKQKWRVNTIEGLLFKAFCLGIFE